MYLACFWKSVGCSYMDLFYVFYWFMCLFYFSIILIWFQHFCFTFCCFVCAFAYTPYAHGGQRRMFAILYCGSFGRGSLNLKLVESWWSSSDASVSMQGVGADMGIDPTISATLLLNFLVLCWIEPFTLYNYLLYCFLLLLILLVLL